MIHGIKKWILVPLVGILTLGCSAEKNPTPIIKVNITLIIDSKGNGIRSFFPLTTTPHGTKSYSSDKEGEEIYEWDSVEEADGSLKVTIQVLKKSNELKEVQKKVELKYKGQKVTARVDGFALITISPESEDEILENENTSSQTKLNRN